MNAASGGLKDVDIHNIVPKGRIRLAIIKDFCALALCGTATLAAVGLTPCDHFAQAKPPQELSLASTRRDLRVSKPSGSIRFHLTGYGYGERLIKPLTGTLAVNGDRLEYQRGDVTEWYLNGLQGLEQGFTLSHRPAGGGHDPLIIAIAVTSELKPVASGNAVEFASGEGVVFRYRGLRVWDARGRHLTSRLELRGRELRLIVDDRNAEYPVTIDPTLNEH